MNQTPNTQEERFATLVEKFADNPDVTPPPGGKRFGDDSLKFHEKIFAMLVKGRFVVKLPKERVDELIASGVGEPFIMRGRTMKEWVAIQSTSPDEWLNFSREAMTFVASLL